MSKSDPIYRVEKDPLHDGRFVVVVAATGKQAHGTASYGNRGQAQSVANIKNRGGIGGRNG